MLKTLMSGLAAALLLAAPASAHDYEAGALSIAHPSISLPKTRAMTAGGYLAITNGGAEADRLIAVETDAAARAEVHTTDHSADGMAKMRHVEAVDLPAGDTVAFERGGYHVMFMGLKQGLSAGDKIPAVLVFEKSGRAEVMFVVEEPEDEAPHQH